MQNKINVSNKSNLFIYVTIINYLIFGICALCEIETKENVAIVEINESLGSQINQTTFPSELPIRGNEREIALGIQSETHNYFKLKGKSLTLIRPLDRDENSLSSIYLQISCYNKRDSIKHSIPVLVKVKDINDNAPKFTNTQPYTAHVSELIPVGSTIFRDIFAKDLDAGNNGLVEYFTVKGDGSLTDGYGYFGIDMPHQGLVTVAKPLDYEKANLYYLTIIAKDKAEKESDKHTATTTLTIHVEDGDDLDPTFFYQGCTLINGACVNPEYKSAVTSESITGILKIIPEKIFAFDRDKINNKIKYSFASGKPEDYEEYIHIDPVDGTIRQIKAINRNNMTKQLEIIIKAEEISEVSRMTTARLSIDVLPADKSPPVVTPSGFVGYVSENSPIGTTVSTEQNGNRPLRVVVSDSDITSDDSPVVYAFEVTSTAFAVNTQGYLVVAEPYLDRDPPKGLETYTFQIIARQIGSPPGKGASAPISLSVHLLDVNDNIPKLPTFTPIRVQAGEGTRVIAQIHAYDIDKDENARVIYSIHHVSNNGKNKFKIDPESGEIEAVGKLVTGDQYSLTLQATDTGNKYSQSILDVIVVPGPNTGGPVFTNDRYHAEISEGASLFSPVVTVNAIDPENDLITYSIIDGNINHDFVIGPHSGIISIQNKLDREEVATYNLIVKAQDKGDLFSTTNVVINVLDVNDQNPEFVLNEYHFKIEEGIPNALVGKVIAKDADIGENGEITYSISDERNFYINSNRGEIYTKHSLDYEKQKSYSLVATAQDRSTNARLATASVTIEVIDVSDELPQFEHEIYESTVPENVANYKIVQVKAIDPDSIPIITYTIRTGDTSLFSINPTTGILQTTHGLDFEKQSSFTLKIGTIENNSDDSKASCIVKITVADINDNPPIFHNLPLPMRIQDTVPLGTIVTAVVATDADGTPPGNQIRYEIVGRDKAPFYFLIDSLTGEISVKDDLRKDPESEYRIVVKAKDLGSPQLTSTTTITVYVEHLAAVSPEASLGFADSKYTVEVEENVLPNFLVKTLPIINKPKGNFAMTCEIISGNDGKKFYVVENDQRDCEVRVKNQQLDYEKQSKYLLTIKLTGVGSMPGASRLLTQLTINILDLNDNRPEFILPPRYSHLTGRRYLAGITSDAPSETQILEIKVKDADYGSNGMVTYELAPHTDQQGRFKIDPFSGILRSSRPVEDISTAQLPIRLKVIARDNPQLLSSSLFESVEVVVNIIEEKHRMALVLKDTSTERVQDAREEILLILQERTGMIAGFEKAESMKMQRNNTIESDVTGTDLWFYLIEPGSFKIISSHDLRIKSSIFDSKPQNSLLKKITNTVGFQAFRLRQPYVPIVMHTTNMASVPITTDVSDLGAVLIILACIIAIFGIAGIVYQCCMWSKYSYYQDKLKRPPPSLPASRLYDPIYVEPNLKEYETQVLQMSVPIIDEDANIDEAFRKLNGKMSLRGYMSNMSNISNMSNMSNLSYLNKQDKINELNEACKKTTEGSSKENNLRNKNPLFCEFMEEHSSQLSYEIKSDGVLNDRSNFSVKKTDKSTDL